MKNQISKNNGLQTANGKIFSPSNYHSVKNNKVENHSPAPQPLTINVSAKTDWLLYELQCAEKIKINTRNIEQFRENTAKIGPLLRAKFETKIEQLEKKNAELHIKMEAFSTTRKKEEDTFNAMQKADLDRFKKEFNGDMDELI